MASEVHVICTHMPYTLHTAQCIMLTVLEFSPGVLSVSDMVHLAKIGVK